MSLFNKVFASFGIGSAKVDTSLEKGVYRAGEKVSGVVSIIGGNVQQEIDSIYLSVQTSYIRESDDRKFTDTASIFKTQLNEPFTVGEQETIEIPFSFELPYDTPLTYGNTGVWVSTGLTIKKAVDPSDKDYIEVQPNTLTQSLLQAIQDLGFRIREVECVVAPSSIRGKYPFLQEFEFVPTSGPFRGKLDELELTILTQDEQSAELLLQVDRKANGIGGLFAEAFEMDENFVRMTVFAQDRHGIKEKLFQEIQRYS
ncbi:sporulation protein [Bacillus sp. 2205SS5-2]|uniref:sporulation protein n=1 Tax=Bacillus sp. 2205SS5-2 TaxID=3109031 RepID=UPI003007ECF5